LALPLILLLSLFVSTILIPANAAPDTAEWSTVNTPTDGKSGNWVLAGGSDIQHLVMAIDGTIYAYANPTGTRTPQEQATRCLSPPMMVLAGNTPAR